MTFLGKRPLIQDALVRGPTGKVFLEKWRMEVALGGESTMVGGHRAREMPDRGTSHPLPNLASSIPESSAAEIGPEEQVPHDKW